MQLRVAGRRAATGTTGGVHPCPAIGVYRRKEAIMHKEEEKPPLTEKEERAITETNDTTNEKVKDGEKTEPVPTPDSGRGSPP
jgi:hypothetical protein